MMNQLSDPSRSVSPAGNNRFSTWSIVALVLAAGLAITAILWANARQAVREELKADLQFHTSMIHSELERRLANYALILRSVQGFSSAGGKLRPQDVHTFISPMGVQQLYPALDAVGIAMVIRKNDMPRHIADMRNRGFPGYAVWPMGERDIYTPITIREPSPGSIGFDMFSNPERRAAMEKARDTGNMVVSGKTRLVRHPDNDRNAGIVVFMPIYRHGKTPTTLAGRRNDIIGWVFAPFMMTRLMDTLSKEHTRDLDISVFDGTDMSKQDRLYRSGEYRFTAFPGDPYSEAIHQVDAGGRTWTLAVHLTPAYEARQDNGKPLVIAGAGVTLSILLALLTWLLATGRERALQLAGRLTMDLKESEKHLRRVMDSTPAMIWESNRDVTQLWVNKTCLDFVGIADVDVFNENWREFIHPDDYAAFERKTDEISREGKPFQHEYRVRRHDGQYRWLLVSGTPRFDKSGKYVGFIGVTLDITDRKHSEDGLMLAALVYQNSSDAMLVSDVQRTGEADGEAVIVDVNPAFTLLTGYAHDEIVGRKASFMRSPKGDPAYFEDMVRSVGANGCWQGEYPLACKNGDIRTAWLNITAIYDDSGRITRHVSLLHDISEQRKAEEQLRLAALVYQNSSDMMMIYDLDNADMSATVVDVNPAFTSEMGYSRDEVVGKSARALYDFWRSPGYYEAMRHDYIRDGHWQGEFVISRKNGEKMVTWLNLNAIPGSTGGATRHVALLRDISGQKEAEETIRSLSASLITAKEDEAKRIAREIHDDLGQRLSWLRINILMLPNLFQKSPEKLDESIGRMRESIDNSIHAVRNIASNLRPATLDMGFVMAMEWLIENFRVNTGIECRLDNGLERDIDLDDLHATSVFRILQEALTNVARHAQATRVEIALRQLNGALHLKISDNGSGFETGHQRKPRSNGLTGMRERAAMLGGQIDIDSTSGGGTRLHVTIPLPASIGVRTDGEGNYC